MRAVPGFLLCLCAAAANGAEMPTKPADRGFIELKGGAFDRDAKGEKSGPAQQSNTAGNWRGEGKDVIAQSVHFPTRGVWYIWLKVSSDGPWPALLHYDLDGIQPLHSARKEILIQPWAKSAWVNHSRFPGFKIEVNVDQPGDHILRFTRKSGSARLEKVLLTLFHSAKLKGDALDMTDDPGHGRISFPKGDLSVDGARKDWSPPEPKVTGVAYYADSEKGDDAADGKSPGKPWKSLANINAKSFQPGDVIFLRRGSRWTEGLRPKGNGAPGKPITIAAYGATGGKEDRPWINGVNRPGVFLLDQSYWTIQDLQATSDPEYKQEGIAVKVSEKAPRAKEIRILNCAAFDTGSHGIMVGDHAGVDGVLIENCISFCNSNDGFTVGGHTAKSGRNSVIRFCTAYSNPGMAGIWIASAENGLIEDCLAYNNACVNIWTWNATNITIRRCEAFRGRPQRDAAGFDIDWGSQACVMEYCYAHHNEGDAFLLMGSGNIEYEGQIKQSNHNIVRYCVGEGHSTFDMGETFNHCKVYNNVGVAIGKNANAFKVFGWPNDANNDGGGWPEDTLVTNNIFIGRSGASAMYVDDHGTEQGNVYDGNLLWREMKTVPLIKWGGRSAGPEFWTGDGSKGTFPPKTYKTLKEFQKATGKGTESIEADPKLANPGNGEYGRLPLDGYLPKKGSPAIGAGKRIVLDPAWLAARRKWLTETGAEAWGIPMEPAQDVPDYAGKPVGANPSLGVREP